MEEINPDGLIVLPQIVKDVLPWAVEHQKPLIIRQPGLENDRWYTFWELVELAAIGDSIRELPWVALCTPNEPNCETPEELTKAVEFDLQFVRDCHAHRFKCVARNWGDGRPGGSWKQIKELLRLYSPVMAEADFDGRHGYNEPEFAMSDWVHFPYHAGRIGREVELIRELGVRWPPYLGTELGLDRKKLVDGNWQGWRADKAGFGSDLASTISTLGSYDWCVGVGPYCFGTGGNPKWDSNDFAQETETAIIALHDWQFEDLVVNICDGIEVEEEPVNDPYRQDLLPKIDAIYTELARLDGWEDSDSFTHRSIVEALNDSVAVMREALLAMKAELEVLYPKA